MVSVAVEDVAPDGSVDRITGGWQVLSLRALDTARSRFLDGHLIQAHHPFTRASEQPLAPGEIVPVDVEIFPTGASIERGHRLRVAVQAFDTPHLLPTLPQLPGALTLLTIHTSDRYPSALTVPAVADTRSELGPAPHAGTTITARLRRSTTGPRARNRVRVMVRSSVGQPGGKVVVRLDGRRVAKVRLRHGVAGVRLPRVRRAGRHLVTVRYLGDPAYDPNSARVIWRVRR